MHVFNRGFFGPYCLRRVYLTLAFGFILILTRPAEPQYVVFISPRMIHTDEKMVKLWKSITDVEPAWSFLQNKTVDKVQPQHIPQDARSPQDERATDQTLFVSLIGRMPQMKRAPSRKSLENWFMVQISDVWRMGEGRWQRTSSVGRTETDEWDDCARIDWQTLGVCRWVDMDGAGKLAGETLRETITIMSSHLWTRSA